MGQEMKPTTTRYEKVRKLGEGTFGSVYQVMDHKSNRTVAMKKIKFVSEDEGVPTNALREIVLLRQLHHPNIVSIYEVHYSWEQNRLFFTMQLHPQNLYQHYKSKERLSPFTVKAYMWQLLEALLYLETKGVLHRDIKPQNILVAADGTVKLCDFGQSKIHLPQAHLTSEVSTLWYKAPQVLLGAPSYTHKVDVWALGCIFAEITQGTPLFKGDSEVGQIFAILQRRGVGSSVQSWRYFSALFPKFQGRGLMVKGLSGAGQHLLESMLEVDPMHRISVARALKHQYFEGM